MHASCVPFGSLLTASCRDPVTPPAPLKKGGRRTRRGEMRSDILLLTGAPPRLVIFIKLITACSNCLCKLLSFCSEWNLRQPHWRRTRRCEMRSDTLLLAGEVPRVVSLIEISPTPLRFSRQPPIAVRSEILHLFRVSSPLF